MHQPKLPHLQAVKHIYIDLQLAHPPMDYSSSGVVPLHSPFYADADQAGCSNTRQSTLGFHIFLSTNLVSRCAKKQPTKALSSTELNIVLSCAVLLILFRFVIYFVSLESFLILSPFIVTSLPPISLSIPCFMLTQNTLSWIITLFKRRFLPAISVFIMCQQSISWQTSLLRDYLPRSMRY